MGKAAPLHGGGTVPEWAVAAFEKGFVLSGLASVRVDGTVGKVRGRGKVHLKDKTIWVSGKVGIVGDSSLSAIQLVGGFEIGLEVGPCLLGWEPEAPEAAGFRVDAHGFQDDESHASHVGDGDLIMVNAEATEAFLTGPKASDRQGCVPQFLEQLQVVVEFISGDGGMLSEQMVDDGTRADLGKEQHQ